MGMQEHGSEAEVEVEELPKSKDDKRELQELKRRKGTWKLAPQLINARALCIKDIILSVGKATWHHFSERAREIVSPQQVLEHNIACARAKFWMAEILEIVHTSLYDSRHLQHLLPQFRGHDKALEWHCDLLSELLQTRSSSLAAFNCMPPNIYHHLLHPLPQVARAAHVQALKHFKILLEAEEAALAGVEVKPLAVMYWRLNPLIRCLYLAFEEDERTYSFFTQKSAANKLLRAMAQHLGDSRVIENVHQHGRDIFRASKANSISNTAIMANVLRSGVLEGRQVPMVKASEYEKAIGPVNVKKESVRASLRTTNKTLPKEIQKLMMPKKAGNTWPSPSPAALFPSAAASQWLFHFWELKERGLDVNAAWLTCIARPGAFIAQRSKGLLIKVLSSAEFGLLGISVRVEELLGGERAYMVNSRSREGIMWHHITDLQDWFELQVQPCLTRGEGHLGPLGWKHANDPLPLEAAALIFGHIITFQQMKALIVLLGGQVPRGQPSKKTLHEMLIGMCVPEEYQEQAKAHIQTGKKKGDTADDGMDTDFSEVLSELGKDDFNLQDLQDLKDKKKHYKMRRVLAAKDARVEPKKRAKAKAKPKGKAKPKAKAKAKSLWHSLMKKAQQWAQQPPVDPGALDVPEGQPPKEPQPPPPAPAEPSSSSGLVARARVSPMGRSPEEIMKALQPPGCRMGISFQDHRITSTWKDPQPQLKAPYNLKSKSSTFVTLRGWKEALAEVHKFNWEKWGLLKAQYPLEKGEREQLPGQIPEALYEQLQGTIDTLGDVKRYYSSKRKDEDEVGGGAGRSRKKRTT